MPRRKQTQPMQRKSSDDIKENEDRLSETGDLDDLADRSGGHQGDTTPTESGECAQARSSCHDFCPADGLEDEADASSKRTFQDAPDLEEVVVAATIERQSSPGDGSVESGSDHSHQLLSLKADLYLDPESPMCSSSPYPVQQNAYPGCFLETLAETGRMEVEQEKENARLNSRRVKLEKLGKTQDHEYDSVDQTLGDIHGKTAGLASGSESGGEYPSPCSLTLPGRASYPKDTNSTSGNANRIAENTVPSYPGVSSENPMISSSSRHQSSVKQLESFVASVECRNNDPGRSGPAAPGVDRKPPSAASTSDRGGIAREMPVVSAAAAALQSRKSKTSSRLKTANNNLVPLTKQASSRGVVESMGGPFAPVSQQKSDPNQPLDLSVKTKRREVSASENKYLSYPCIQDVSSFGSVGATSGSSSLADLEKKFGNTSAIFDRIGTKSWASPFCGALVSRIGMNLYNNSAKLHHGGPFGDPAATSGVFGLNMIPVPVQRFNSANQQAPPAAAAKPDVSLGVKPDQGESCANDLESSNEPRSSALPDSRFQWHAPKQNSATTSASGPPTDPQRKHTNFQCSCGAELETLYQLTMHLQQTGHAPNKMKSVGRQEYSKLVRGQDMWLNHGCEQTRQILRCMECDESFKSLPELTVHMIQTKHYANIVGTDALQKKPPLLLPPSKTSCETRSVSSSEEEDEEPSGGVHCPVCFETFDDPETLGIHIVETGHYKRRTPERRGDATADAPSVKDLGGQWGRGWQNSSGSLTPVRPSPPQSGAEDNAESPDPATGKSENDRKRNHSLSECSLIDDYKETTELNQGGGGGVGGGAGGIGDALRYSDSEDAPVKYKRFDEKGSSSSFIRTKTPSFDLQINMTLDRSRSQACDEEDSLSEEANLKSPGGFRPHLSGRTDQDRSSFGRLEEDRAEPPSLNSSAFQVENFFRPPSGSSSDGSAIRAMETFIKKSFGPSEAANHRLPALSSMGSTTSLVESLMTRFGCYAESLGQPAAARQESRVSEALENSKNLYQNKYLPPVYTAPPSTDDRSQCGGGGGGEMVLPAGGQFLPLERKIKTETSEVTTKRDPDQFSSQDSEHPMAESDGGTLRDLERSGNTEKARKANRRKQSQRQDQTPSPEYYAKSGTDSTKRDKYTSSSVKSHKPADLKSVKRMMKGELNKEPETDERPSSTSINDLPESSALESLQGLVYGKTLNTEHPLDSLQRLIYGRGGSTVAGVQVGRVGPPGHPLNGSNGGSHAAAVIMKGSEALHHPLPPGTLILVNPIVTVVPGASGGNPSLNITIPGGCESSPRAGGDDRTGKPSDQGGGGGGRRNRSPTVDDRENSLRVYRCRGCRRKFSSKGSYRYHLSRCHVLTSSSSLSSSSSSLVGPEKCPSSVRKGPYACMPLDATAKFNKYYQLASELGTEAK